MKPVSLLLRGFRGIRDGLGRDELALDLAALTGDAQLIAICGANGRGKTTVLDNLTPYPTMPSRAGGDGSGAFSYYEHVCLPESVKDLVWEHGGRRYRSQLVIRNDGRRRTEAYLYGMECGRWSPVTTGEGTVSDGKMDTYVRCLEAILGPDRTFFVSAFAAQGRRQLCAYRTAEVKALLADLLGLEDIRSKGVQAAEVAKLLRIGLGVARDELVAASLELDEANSCCARLPAIDRDLAAARARRSALQEQIEQARTALARLEAECKQAAQNDISREELQAELDRVTAACARQEAELAADRQREAARLARLGRESEEKRAQYKSVCASISAQRRQALAVIGETDRIRRAMCRLEMARALVVVRERRVRQCGDTLAGLRSLEERERGLDREIESIERAAGQAALRVAEVQRRFSLTQAVPCKGMPMQEECRLLSNARAARPLIPSATAELEQLNETRSGLRSQLALLRVQIARLQMAPRRLAKEEVRLACARRRAETITALAARGGEIAQAEAIVRECGVRLEQLEGAALAGEAARVEEQQTIEAAIAQIELRMEQQRPEHCVALEGLRKRLGQLALAVDPARLAATQQALRVAQVGEQASEEVLQTLLYQRAVAEEALATTGRLHERCQNLRTKCEVIEAELSTWAMFARCMGSDGLIALMIDDAGPELSSLASDLLVACYGPRFTVSIHTQVETAKGEAREGFDIVVHDGESGQSKPMARMSGGERVWINDCLTRAIALYVAQCSGRRYETLFTDESDGPLDADHKRMFMRMKREVLRLGGYEREYFISQTPEMAAMADVVIDLDAMLITSAS